LFCKDKKITMADDKKVDDNKTFAAEIAKLKSDNTMLKKIITQKKSSRGPANSNRPKQLGSLQTLQTL
jgi:hypothetical protein